MKKKDEEHEDLEIIATTIIKNRDPKLADKILPKV